LGNEDAQIREAVAALQIFDWIGLVESFDASIARLGELLQIPVPPTLPRENTTAELSGSNSAFEPVEKTQAGEDERRRILALNKVDLAVYESARGLTQQGMAV
jgi:hypothetical protein